MPLKTELITPNGDEPVTVNEIKSLFRIEGTDEDSLIQGLIAAARELAEKILRRAILNQTWDLYLDDFPKTGSIYLPYPKLQSVTWLKYYDEQNQLQTLSGSVYEVDAITEPGRVALVSGQSWPSVYDRLNAVQVRFVAGYGATAASVPSAVKLAIKHLVGHWLEHREPFVAGVKIEEVPITFERILMPYRFLELK